MLPTSEVMATKESVYSFTKWSHFRELTTFFHQEMIINTLGLGAQATMQLYQCMKSQETLEQKYLNEHGCISIKVYLQRWEIGYIWLAGHKLQTSGDSWDC